MTVVAELNIIPLGKGVSVSTWLVPAIHALETRGVKYEVTPMSTVFEAASVAEAFAVAQAAHEAVIRAGVARVVTTLKLDDRRDVAASMEDKVATLHQRIRDANAAGSGAG
jgi:uncharacterized protein (TIGR00106 family)